MEEMLALNTAPCREVSVVHVPWCGEVRPLQATSLPCVSSTSSVLAVLLSSGN